ncbi:unnamed protein product [Symbiodinium pilosum]|uniref:Uncharacterized protein n=1 Tax=Symbiodinium pilosum TaxID=2952 RepID=A0A812JC71_SYMPI|nr:unnamed protein product [Symbiodinium pilosum]
MMRTWIRFLALAVLVILPAGQLPLPRTLPGCGAPAPGAPTAPLQDAVEGIAGLMQRFEQMQPQIATLPPAELQQVAEPAQRLHERFEAMQQKLMTRSGGPDLEEEAIVFHRDLAVFVDQVSSRLGITSPARPARSGLVGSDGAGFAPVSLGSLPGQGSAVPGIGGAASESTERRLQAAMQAIQSGMQRFEALHPKLPNLPPQAFNTLANKAQQLHEEFLTLQKKGIQLAGDGRQPMLEADAAPYADQLESFVSRQISLVNEAEQQVQQLATLASSGGGYQGMLGHRLPSGLTPSPREPGMANIPQMPPMPPAQTQMQASIPGQVTPATDAKLSGMIDKVIRLMQEFQSLVPQLTRVSQQAIAPLANVGASLDTRFRELQRRGNDIAGDTTRPMTENDASEYLHELEAFYAEQERYVEQVKEMLKSNPSAAPGLRAPGAGIGLGSARLEDLRGGPAGPGAANGASGMSTSGLQEAAPVSGAGIAGFGGGNFQPSGTFGAGLRPPSPSISSTGLGQGLGAAPMPSLPGFGGGFGKTLPVNSFPSSSGGSRTGPAGIRPDVHLPKIEAPGLSSLEEMGSVKLNTAVLPENGVGVCSGGASCGDNQSRQS